MTNPIFEILRTNTPFTFFHTHVLDRVVMDEILAAHKTFEIDISITDAGEAYIGHPLYHYEVRGLPPPSNLPLEQAIQEGLAAGLFIMLDVKDAQLLPLVEKLINQYGSEHFLFHSFCKELSFKPYPPKVKAVEGQGWDKQELPLDKLLELKRSTGVPLVVSCHGITRERLETESTAILPRILEVAQDKVEIVNLFMPHDEAPPLHTSMLFLEHGIIPLVPIDHTPPGERPKVYFGATNKLEHAS